MKILLLAITQLFFIGFYACSQSFLGSNKATVTYYVNRGKVKKDITSTDSTISCQIIDTAFKKDCAIFHFDKKGRCDSEIMIFDCEQCYLSNINKMVHNSKWVKVDSIRYVTKRGKPMVLGTHYKGLAYAYEVKKLNEAERLAIIEKITATQPGS